MRLNLYTCLVEEQNDQEAFVQVYWSKAEHLGKAIDLILSAARSNGLTNPIVRECDPYDIDNLEGEVEPSIKSEVFWSTSRHFFPPEPTFNLPVGIISSCIEGEHDIDEIESGYTEQLEEGLITIEINAEESRLFDLYKKIVSLYSLYKVFWYVLHDHWDDGDSDIFLVNEKINTPEKIISHIEVNKANSLLNGYVTLTAFLEEGSTNICITDHKRLIIRTYSELVASRIKKLLETEKYQKHEYLVNIEYRMHHWHYRIKDSKRKEELACFLKSIGFTVWEPAKSS
jgi:hypothetical protein